MKDKRKSVMNCWKRWTALFLGAQYVIAKEILTKHQRVLDEGAAL